MPEESGEAIPVLWDVPPPFADWVERHWITGRVPKFSPVAVLVPVIPIMDFHRYMAEEAAVLFFYGPISSMAIMNTSVPGVPMAEVLYRMEPVAVVPVEPSS